MTTIKPLISAKFLSSSGKCTYTTKIFDTFSACTCPGHHYRQKCAHVIYLKVILEAKRKGEEPPINPKNLKTYFLLIE